MRVVEVSEFGAPEVLRLTDRPGPLPTPGMVRVRMGATTVSPADLLIRSGRNAGETPELRPPFVLGFDIAGTLLDDTAEMAAGQPVAGLLPWFQLATGEGTYAEVVQADPAWLAPIPEELDMTVAASAPLSSLTAIQAIDLVAGADDTVLVTHASGMIGRLAVQYAAGEGVRVVALAPANVEEDLRDLGASEFVATDSGEDTLARVLRLAPERGVDGVFDTGSGSLAVELMPAVRDHGAFVAVGGVVDLPAGERGIRVGSVPGSPDSDRLSTVLEQLAAGELKTRIYDVLALENAAEAHRQAESRNPSGRLVLTF